MTNKKYKVKIVFVPSETEEQKELYLIEEERNKLIRKNVHQWLKITKIEKKEFWVIGLPSVLYSLLGSWDTKASITASIEFLRNNKRLMTKTQLKEMVNTLK